MQKLGFEPVIAETGYRLQIVNANDDFGVCLLLPAIKPLPKAETFMPELIATLNLRYANRYKFEHCLNFTRERIVYLCSASAEIWAIVDAGALGYIFVWQEQELTSEQK